MSAIGAIITQSSSYRPVEAIGPMARTLRMYGVDDIAQEDGKGWAMVRALYRLTPEDHYDQQPLSLSGGGARLLFDGRVDNRQDLLFALGCTDGEEARGWADSTILAMAIEKWGLADTLPRLCGPFALVHFDLSKSLLTLARDEVGYRPLFFTRQTDFIAVSSMPKGLHALPGMARDMNVGAVAERFLQSPQRGTTTLFEEVQRVPPGHLVELSFTSQTVRRWRGLEELTVDRSRSFEENLQAFDAAMNQAVEAQLRRIGGIGGQLSSGIDGATVMGIAVRKLPPRTSFHAFTAAPADPSVLPEERRDWLDESRRAKAIADHFPFVQHHVISNDATNLANVVVRYNNAQDAPLQLPLHTCWFDAIGRVAHRKGIKVVLTGLSGNLGFSAGYGLVEPSYRRDYGLLAWQRLLAQRVANGTISWKAWLRTGVVDFLPGKLRDAILKAAKRWRQMNEIDRLNPEVVRRYDLASQQAEWNGNFTQSKITRTSDVRIFSYDLLDIGAFLKALLAETGVDFRDPCGDNRVRRLALTVPHEQYFKPRDRAFGHALFSRYIAPDLADEAISLSGRQNADMAATLSAVEEDIVETFERGASGPAVFAPVPPGILTAQLGELRSELGTLSERNFGAHGDKVRNIAWQYTIQAFINSFNHRNYNEDLS
ncbi:asparagine synthase-related protein [Novosphingobium beihaiensis]|uniref:asparagine synthase (glutamine-hydrolyzing) n=1 Tax=Novosphingobium beihaiensis TaxID=2930389 RepID=A0ABT0BVW6_9SPHN|nr:asparagine synthase-related protein [Novosphingobium beihaiensis]MCJ2189197.1 asparagine synthase-related protein [Novosphingobium beihaiensis]